MRLSAPSPLPIDAWGFIPCVGGVVPALADVAGMANDARVIAAAPTATNRPTRVLLMLLLCGGPGLALSVG